MANIHSLYKYNIKHKWNVAGYVSVLSTNATHEDAVALAEQLANAHNMEEVLWNDVPPGLTPTRYWISPITPGGISCHMWIEKIEMT